MTTDTQRGASGDLVRLTVEQIMAMRREAEADWPRLGRMQCGELADVAVTATRAVLALTTEAVCTDWYDMPTTERIEAAERVIAAVRTTVELAADAREWFPDHVMDALNAYDASLTPARDETAVGN